MVSSNVLKKLLFATAGAACIALITVNTARAADVANEPVQSLPEPSWVIGFIAFLTWGANEVSKLKKEP